MQIMKFILFTSVLILLLIDFESNYINLLNYRSSNGFTFRNNS